MEHIVYGIAFFILGTLIGSFLNVCAYRIPRGESVAFPPSRCTSCESKIRPLDNVPIVSYLLLAGKCRACGTSISMRYPIVEGITGLLWIAAYLHFGLSLKLAGGLLFITVMILLSAIDLDTSLIPDKIVLPAIAVSAALLPFSFLNIDILPLVDGYGSIWSVFGFFAGGGALYLIAIMGRLMFKKEAMGGGDLKLAAFAGLFLGGYVLIALFFGFIMGAVAGIAVMSLYSAQGRDPIPFGPFISAGSILTVFFGPEIWFWYLNVAGLA